MQVHENNLAYVPVLTPKGREAGKIHFVPGDDGIHQRAIEAKPHFLALLKPLASADITPDGKGADKRSEGLISEAEKIFSELLDYVCGVCTAQDAFQQYRPFAAMSDGSFWATSVMKALNCVVNTDTANIKRKRRKRK
ncbi:MAG: hypothetical protein MSS53_02170 [Oscillibacter sp.]|nr:hypothetical protein [Oscillibacter sp.]